MFRRQSFHRQENLGLELGLGKEIMDSIRLVLELGLGLVLGSGILYIPILFYVEFSSQDIWNHSDFYRFDGFPCGFTWKKFAD
ncbi:unnamed protein product [Rhizophagus irregularis]|nr:unnamed protein product [Rhizophagus irregularis]